MDEIKALLVEIRDELRKQNTFAERAAESVNERGSGAAEVMSEVVKILKGFTHGQQ